MAYKVFIINDIEVTALGDLEKDLGDELRAFKKKEITFPSKIIENINSYIEFNNTKFDIIINIPSNKNKGVMDFFADYICIKYSIKKIECIKLKRNIKEQKFLETLKERSENIKNAFELSQSDLLEGKNILLIDDVYASGETLKEVIGLFEKLPFHFNLKCMIFCYRNYIF